MPHRILTTHPDTGARGIYLDGEIAGRAALWLPESSFPALRGSGAQRITNLDTDLAAALDAQIPSTNSQRVRVKIIALGPPLVYRVGVFASASAITPNWWA